MHTYSVDNNERVKIIFGIVIVSYFLTILINHLLGLGINLISKIDFIDNIISKIEFIGVDIRQITLFAVFGLIYNIFIKNYGKQLYFRRYALKYQI